MKAIIRISFFMIFFLTPFSTWGQDTLLVELLKENHSRITYSGQSFSGEGWDQIKESVRNAGNVLIGEDHFIKEIPAFSGALLNVGDFDNLVIEMDPYSTEIIESSIRDLSDEEREAFNEEYKQRFSFYALDPEYKLLQQAVRDNINLLGAEQIIKFADRLILQKLVEITENEKAKSIYSRMMEQSEQYFRKFLKDPDRTTYFMTSQFMQHLDTLNTLSLSRFEESVIKDMKLSRTIYEHNDHRKRIRLMKHILLNRLEEWYRDKNLFKYGAVHMPAGESLLSIFDVGNLVLNVSDARFKNSYHIAVVAKSGMKGAPFPGMPNTNIDSSKGMLSSLSPFFSVVSGNKWYAFDLLPIRKALNSGELEIHDNKLLERVIQGYDTLVIIPEATASGF